MILQHCECSLAFGYLNCIRFFMVKMVSQLCICSIFCLFSLLSWDKIYNGIEIKVISDIIAFPVVSQFYCSFFRMLNTTQNQQQKSTSPPKKDFVMIKVLLIYILKKIRFYQDSLLMHSNTIIAERLHQFENPLSLQFTAILQRHGC